MRTQPFIRVALLALGVAAAISACGGSSTPASSSLPAGGGAPTPSGSGGTNSVQACTALTASEAATITGDSSIATVGSTAVAGLNLCEYVDATSGPGAGSSVALLIEPSPGISSSLLEAVLAGEDKTGSTDYQPVSGLGDAAYSEASANSAGLVFVKSNTLAVIAASSPTASGSSLLSAIESVAQSVAGHV